MAEEFQLGSGNWWDSSSSSSSTTPPLTTPLSSFSWRTDIVDIKNRSSLDSESVSGKYGETGRRDVLSVNPNLQMMGLGLDWNQSLLRGEMCSNTDHQQEASSHQDHQWGQRIYFRNSEDSSVNDYKHQSVFSSHVMSSNLEIAPVKGSPPNMMQLGVSVSDNHNQTNQESLNFSPYNPNPAVADIVASSSWSKFTQLVRTSDPQKQQPQSQLHFSNNTPFWNATAAAMNDVRSSFFPSLQTQPPNVTVDKKPKMHTTEVSETSTMVKKITTTSSETPSKRPRNETPSPLPAFKVKKEKMGDRVTALQQLVSPFGKTDTASVLSEATEYIKFLHEQVSALSNPYMKNGASMQHRQSFDKSNEPKQDLRSRGLCLVPVSSTFPVTHETTIDFWTPNSFGGPFR